MHACVPALAALVGLAGAALAADWPLRSARIAVTRTATGEHVRFVAKDRALPVPMVNGADDPSRVGMRLTLVGPPGGVRHVDIPPGIGKQGWTVRQTTVRRSYRWRNADAPGGPSLVRSLRIAEGRGMKLDLRGDVGVPAGPLGVRVEMGAARACTAFDGTGILAREPTRFVGRVSDPVVPSCDDVVLGVPPPTVWMFGDSNTVLACPYVRDAHPEWDVACKGVGAETTSIGLDRLRTALATESPPQVVVLAEGVNDVARIGWDAGIAGCSAPPFWHPSVVNGRLLAMAQLVRDAGGTPIVASLLYDCPVHDGGCLALRPEDPAACPGLRCFLDAACELSGLVTATHDPWVDEVIPGTEFADLLHPTVAGRELIAARVGAAVAAALAARR